MDVALKIIKFTLSQHKISSWIYLLPIIDFDFDFDLIFLIYFLCCGYSSQK